MYKCLFDVDVNYVEISIDQEHSRRIFLLLFQMNVFLQELNHLPVGISVYGMFLITKESALTVSKTYNWTEFPRIVECMD